MSQRMNRTLIAVALAVAPFGLAAAQHSHGTAPSPGRGRQEESAPWTPPPPMSERRIEVRATEQGFDPALVIVKRGERIRFVVTRVTENTPAKEIVLDEAIFFKELLLNRPVSVAFTPGRTGEFPYTSANGAVRGVLRVEN